MNNYRDVELTIGTARVYSPPLAKIDGIMDKDPNLKRPEPEVEVLERKISQSAPDISADARQAGRP